MGVAPTASTARTVYFERADGVRLEDGATYVPGESLTAHISSTASSYVLEVNTDAFDGLATAAVHCSVEENGYTRVNSASSGRSGANGKTVVAPTDGSDLVLKGVWAGSYGGTVRLNQATLSAASATLPTAEPTAAPMVSPTAAPTATPIVALINVTEVVGNDDDSMLSTLNPSTSPSQIPTTVPSSADTMTMSVEISLQCDAASSESDVAAVRSALADEMGVTEASLRHLTLISFIQTGTQRQRRRLMANYQWNVAFELTVSIDAAGYASADALQTSIAETLENGAAGAVERSFPSITFLSEVVAVVVARTGRASTSEPTASPTSAQAGYQPVGIASASLPTSSILLTILGIAVLALTPAVAAVMYIRARKAKEDAHCNSALGEGGQLNGLMESNMA